MESSLPEHHRQAELLLDSLLAHRESDRVAAGTAAAKSAVPSLHSTIDSDAGDEDVYDHGISLPPIPTSGVGALNPALIPATYRIGVAGPPGAGA